MRKLNLLFAALVVLPVALLAASENSATVKFDEPVTVGASTLKAGTYNVSWTEPGPDAKVTFSQGKKDFAVVPASVAAKKNSNPMIFTATSGSAKVLQGLDLKNASLNFNPTAASGK